MGFGLSNSSFNLGFDMTLPNNTGFGGSPLNMLSSDNWFTSTPKGSLFDVDWAFEAAASPTLSTPVKSLSPSDQINAFAAISALTSSLGNGSGNEADIISDELDFDEGWYRTSEDEPEPLGATDGSSDDSNTIDDTPIADAIDDTPTSDAPESDPVGTTDHTPEGATDLGSAGAADSTADGATDLDSADVVDPGPVNDPRTLDATPEQIRMIDNLFARRNWGRPQARAYEFCLNWLNSHPNARNTAAGLEKAVNNLVRSRG